MLFVNDKVIVSLCMVMATLWTLSNGAESQSRSETSGSETKMEPEKRFYSWEGKRYDDSKQVEKRKFYQWAGKRSENEVTDTKSGGGESTVDQDQDQDVNKRKFYQWAGKRKFYAWAGKRDMDDDEAVENHNNVPAGGSMEKRKFYQWAGKRAEETRNEDTDISDTNALDKRKFYAWAGKRTINNNASGDNNDQVAEKRKFYAWAGRK